MHTILPFFLAMIAAIVLLNMWVTKLKIAYPILLVLAGLVISLIPGLPMVKVDPELIFFIFLPPLLFEDNQIRYKNYFSAAPSQNKL